MEIIQTYLTASWSRILGRGSQKQKERKYAILTGKKKRINGKKYPIVIKSRGKN